MLKLVTDFLKEVKPYTDENSIFIYQMGKVGSSSLSTSIQNAVHFHTLYFDNYPCKPRQIGLLGLGIKRYYLELRQKVIYRLRRKAILSRQRIKVICPIRNPLDRNISMFFHDLDAYLFENTTRLVRRTVPSTRFTSKEHLFELFEKSFPHRYPVDWFDNEIHRTFDVNVYEHEYNKKLGYMRIKKENLDLLIVEQSMLDGNQDLLEEFVGERINISSDNRGEDKWYHSIYKDFKAEYKPSKNIESQLENSKYFKHFYES